MRPFSGTQWIEGHIEGVTGWAIGEKKLETEGADDRSKDAASLYDKLEHIIIPMFYRRQDQFIDVMRHQLPSMVPSLIPTG